MPAVPSTGSPSRTDRLRRARATRRVAASGSAASTRRVAARPSSPGVSTRRVASAANAASTVCCWSGSSTMVCSRTRREPGHRDPPGADQPQQVRVVVDGPGGVGDPQPGGHLGDLQLAGHLDHRHPGRRRQLRIPHRIQRRLVTGGQVGGVERGQVVHLDGLHRLRRAVRPPRSGPTARARPRLSGAGGCPIRATRASRSQPVTAAIPSTTRSHPLSNMCSILPDPADTGNPVSPTRLDESAAARTGRRHGTARLRSANEVTHARARDGFIPASNPGA